MKTLILFFSILVQVLPLSAVYGAEWQMTNPQFVTPAGDRFINPQWHPMGEQLIVSGLKFRGIYLIDVPEKRFVKTLSGDCGFGARFVEGGRYLLTRKGPGVTNAEPEFKLLNLADGACLDVEHVFLPGYSFKLPPQGKMNVVKGERISFTDPTQPIVFIDKSENVVLLKDNSELRLTIDGGYYDPHLAPDGQTALAHHKNGEIHLIQLSDKTHTVIATGERASFLNSKHILYQVSQDNGVIITNSKLFIYTIPDSKSFQLHLPEEYIPLSPTASPDGGLIAFEDYRSGRIVTGKLEGRLAQ